MKQIIVIGRGHSGTRCMIHTLQEAGMYCGRTNGSGDHLPAQPMYDAVRLFGALVQWDGYDWDLSRAMNAVVPVEYQRLVMQYTQRLQHHATHAWKLPETVLALPWLVWMYPQAYYIHWVRDGRDNILRWHGTEDNWYGVDMGTLPGDRKMRAALSWVYHETIIDRTPKPEHWLTVRFEDFLLDNDNERARIGAYLGMHLPEIYINPRVVRRHQNYDMTPYLPVMAPYLVKHGYLEREPIEP